MSDFRTRIWLGGNTLGFLLLALWLLVSTSNFVILAWRVHYHVAAKEHLLYVYHYDGVWAEFSTPCMFVLFVVLGTEMILQILV